MCLLRILIQNNSFSCEVLLSKPSLMGLDNVLGLCVQLWAKVWVWLGYFQSIRRIVWLGEKENDREHSLCASLDCQVNGLQQRQITQNLHFKGKSPLTWEGLPHCGNIVSADCGRLNCHEEQPHSSDQFWEKVVLSLVPVSYHVANIIYITYCLFVTVFMCI